MMNTLRARDLAKQYVPNSVISFDDSQLKTSKKVQKVIDINRDGQMSEDELFNALQQNKVTINTKKNRATLASVDLFSEPPARKDNPYSGAETLGIGNTETQLTVSNRSTTSYIFNKDLDQMTHEVNDPDKVASLLDDLNYDEERGKPLGGDGPLGTQTPEDTLSMFSGVCRDMHQLGAYLLSANGYDAVQVGYTANRTSHSFLSYRPPGAKGYGVVEYGRNYTPEDIEKILGRPALSPKEALSALRPEAKMIFGWTAPEKGQEGSVEDIFYTFGHKLYQQTLKLSHEDSMTLDRTKGFEIEKTLSEHWSIKAGVNFDSPADPTAKGATHLSVGYQWGDFDNWGRVSGGVQYRPGEGHHDVGPNTWTPNPTFLGGLSLDGQVTPFKHQFSPNHWTKTTIYGNLSGAFLALNKELESDAGVVIDKGIGYDLDMITGLHQGNLRLSQHFGGNFNKHFSYQAEVFNDFDISLMIPAYSMGGSGYYANVGANASLKYHNGPLALSVGAQGLVHKVSNKEENAVVVGFDYAKGPLRVGADAKLLPSAEGQRFVFNQYANVMLKEPKKEQDTELYLGVQGKQGFTVGPQDVGVYTNPGDNNIGFTFGGSF